ncbi:hypothetical protein AQUCO_00100704v1 [Aquilegia coerulea]|uniref:Uncharacterized protein n=1 Tax=Aquilegia coerulea TaxID=218851 RepID=A0A2G5FBJ9_AQUCA|nr:hypothetical protein AQUCO_00100704v1 [Aquilegia coerulea]
MISSALPIIASLKQLLRFLSQLSCLRILLYFVDFIRQIPWFIFLYPAHRSLTRTCALPILLKKACFFFFFA